MSPTVPSDASPGGAVVGPVATPLTPQARRRALAPRTRRARWARPRPLRPSPRGRRRPPLAPVRARAGEGAPDVAVACADEGEAGIWAAGAAACPRPGGEIGARAGGRPGWRGGRGGGGGAGGAAAASQPRA